MSRSSRRSSFSSSLSVKLRNRKSKVSVKCSKHSGQDIEIFCNDHDMVYCSECDTDHRCCRAVYPVTDIPRDIIEELERLEIDKKTTIIHNRLQSIQQKNFEHIRFLREHEKEIIKDIEAMYNQLIHHISYLRDAALTLLNKERKAVERNIEKDIVHISKITDQIENYPGRASKSGKQKSGGKCFIRQKLKQSICAEAECILDVMNSCQKNTIEFSMNHDLYDYVLSENSLGDIHKEVLTAVPEIQCIEKTKVKGKRDQTTCGISGICQLPDGTVIVCDNNNDKLKRLNDQYKVRDECNLAMCPTGVCCTGEHEVAVKMYNNKINFVTVKEHLSVTRTVQINSGNVVGIQYCFDKLWVSEMNALRIYSTSGKFDMVTLDKTENSHTLRSSPQQIAFGNDETVFVSDFSNRALCLNEHGDIISILTDRRLRQSQGICVSRDNIVFVAGYGSNNIVMFGKDGKRLGEIQASELGLRKPCSLAFDERNNALLIGCWEGNELTIVHFDR